MIDNHGYHRRITEQRKKYVVNTGSIGLDSQALYQHFSSRSSSTRQPYLGERLAMQRESATYNTIPLAGQFTIDRERQNNLKEHGDIYHRHKTLDEGEGPSNDARFLTKKRLTPVFTAAA